jgi:hypothetical protein
MWKEGRSRNPGREEEIPEHRARWRGCSLFFSWFLFEETSPFLFCGAVKGQVLDRGERGPFGGIIEQMIDSGSPVRGQGEFQNI